MNSVATWVSTLQSEVESRNRKIKELEAKLNAVKPHIADLRRCADVLQQNIGDPMKGTIAEICKAANELEAATGDQE